MFNKKKEIALDGDLKSGSINIIGIGTEIDGNLITKGDIRIDGKIIGDVSVKAKVVIGISGEVIGNLIGENAEIAGLVNGDINITETLYITATAQVKGNISSNKLMIAQGAQLTGYCQTGITQTKSILKANLNEGKITNKEAIA
jgi:cytoskeletal protein CcmA (bactofilin family)